MKNIIVVTFLTLLMFSNKGMAQESETITTNGKNIIDPCGNIFIPRGINYALLDDWDFPANLNNGELSKEIIKANPNIVRVQWYVDYGQASRPAFTLNDLDSVISRFARANIVTILVIHDATCSDDQNIFQNIVNYWTSSDMVNLIQKHQKHLMLNIANEYKYVNWASDVVVAANEYTTEYNTAINMIRDAGIKVPLIIDAPDCGTSLQVLLNSANALYSSDSLHNIILSDHAYYYANTPTMMSDFVSYAANCSVPVLFGEIADIQDATAACSDSIPNYPSLLQACENDSIGWLAWVWTDDICNSRRMTTDGLFSNLTIYGNDIVNNPSYGLMGHARKACFDTIISTSSITTNESLDLKLFPNPTQSKLEVHLNTQKNMTQNLPLVFSIQTLLGKEIQLPTKLKENGVIIFDLKNIPNGFYLLHLKYGRTNYTRKIIKI